MVLCKACDRDLVLLRDDGQHTNQNGQRSIQCLSPAKKYKLYKSSINKSIHFVQRNLSSSTKKVPGELVN